MAVLLSAKNISKSFGSRPLFENLSFGLFEGERTGLIGPNGAGKSTLLKILTGVEKNDEGEIAARRGLRVGYLAQQDRFEAVGESSSVKDHMTQALQGLGLEDYEVDIRVDAGLDDAGFKNHDQPVNKLSGGWRKRLAILTQVLREPDLLLLDEPTNHLDLEGVLWLEGFLSGLTFAFLVITHDRRFLDRVCNRVIELNKRYVEGHFSSAGNYSDFLESREKLFSAQEAREASVRNTVRREIEWLRRRPKARTTKAQARIDRAGNLMNDLAELKYRNTQTRSVDIDFSGSERQTKCLLELGKVEKSLGGRKLFGPLDLMLRPGDKLGLLGANGSGKSTLLKILAGQLAPDSGTVKRAERLQIVTFDQHRDQLDLNLPLRKALCENGDQVQYRGNPIHIAGWADRFLFRKEQLNTPLRELSGGEQSRVLIARLMLKTADLLLLDEPTNDLDIHSLEVLESSLQDFPGALVLVTHDRYLLDCISQNILALDGKGQARFFADLAQWEDWQADQEALPPSPPQKNPPVKKEIPPLKDPKELKKLETSIHQAEEQVEQARRALEDPAFASNVPELMTRQQAYDSAKLKVETLYKRWEALQEDL